MFGGTAHVVLGSGLTIAGATFCLHFTNLPYFQTLGIPLAIGMVVVVDRRADPWPRGDFGGVAVPPNCSNPSERNVFGDGARSAPSSSAGPGRSWSRPSRVALVGC